MIEYIKGCLIEKNPTYAVIECNGVAYYLNISLGTYSALSEDQDVKLYTHTVIREDAHVLFGFFTREEREIFRKLISVSGVGAGTARTILSSIDSSDIVSAIEAGDVSVFKNVKGIGMKTAQRIILDLKGKIDLSLSASSAVAKTSSVRNEALDALEVLGFVRKNCEKHIDDILLNYHDTTVENLIKMTLKSM
ncbi:MAG: Holliday junction branch migration protein RuvA [Flavobacteriales bacterium]|nr:Holliday junction branch migration protein RuvA [Flavobacteriales bacterium]